MRLKRTDVIAGQPIKLARDLAKELSNRDDGASVEWIAKWVLRNDDVAKAQALVDEMTKRSWLKKTKKGSYECTSNGRSLALARLLSPITRTRAEKIVADLIERARAINANPDLITWVKQLRVFGSFISTSDDLGDVDVAFELERREPDGERWVDASQKRAMASGKQLNFIERLCCGDHEVRLLLKNRERYLSLHEVEDLARLKVASKLIYERTENTP